MKYTKEQILELQPGDKIKIPLYQTQYKSPFFPNYNEDNRSRTNEIVTVRAVKDAGNTVRVYIEECNDPDHRYVTLSQIKDIICTNANNNISGFFKKRQVLVDQLESIEEKIREIDSKIEYMNVTQKEKFILKEYQAYKVLTVIEEKKDLTRQERADLIAKLIT